MRRFAEEVDRRVEDAGFGPGWLNRRFGGDLGSLFRWEQGDWSPQVEILQRQDQLVVRVDLPGVKKEDVRLHCTGDALTIEGERRRETEENGEGFYRSERSYGAFSRTIPLPAGAEPDGATARFNDGVLEIVIPAPGTGRDKGQQIPIQ
jgi:HSP20 family protein